MGSENQGQVAVVVGVGAEQGLGAALGRRFAREGLHTFLAGRTAERLEAVVKAIEAAGGRATAVPCDTTRSEEVSALLDRAMEEASRECSPSTGDQAGSALREYRFSWGTQSQQRKHQCCIEHD